MKIVGLITGLLYAGIAAAQVAPTPSPPPAAMTADSASRLEVLQAARYMFEKKDSINRFLSLAGSVRLKQDKTLMNADSAVINQGTVVVEAFGNIHINDNDSLHTYARYVKYLGREKKAFLKTNVRLVDSKGGVLTTPELDYDLNTSIATYTKGGKVVNKKTVLTSKKGTYYGSTNEVIFKKDVELINPEYSIYTDSLQYNTETEVATFVAPTTIINGKRRIYTSSGYYDLKAGKAVFAKRSTVLDTSYSIVADDMAFDDKEGIGQFKGNVVFVDTANGVSILSNQVFANNKKSSFLAVEKPLMILKQDQDSVFITADTLFSGRITEMPASREIPVIQDTAGKAYVPPDLKGKDSTMNRFFEAWNHVRIYSDSVQAVCDSFFYAGTDSAFRLYRNPVVWSNDSQITADTMYLFTKNKKADRLRAYFNGFIINKLNASCFNQVKGNTVNAWFKEGNIDYMRAKGRAESVYYAQDEEDKFVGMNRSSSDAIDMFFDNRKPVKVKFINDLKGVTYPMSQIPPDELKLKGFSWQDDKRPKTRYELMGN